jgi:endonuclease/exonuclease/phosphatase family metal-dependent hydrolase
MSADPDHRSLRVATWNVHACVGGDGRFDPHRVMSVMRVLSPDIVALQEVDSRRRLARDLDVFAFLREHLGGHAAEARTIVTGEGDYGHMVLSRWPLGLGRVHEITAAGREPRAILDVPVLSPFGPIRVFGAHFGLARGERRMQTAALRALVETRLDGAAIVAGDFNELRRASATHKALIPMFQPAPIFGTYPSWRPLFALDRIWCRAPLRVRECHVPRGVRGASDHLPLIADLDWIGP